MVEREGSVAKKVPRGFWDRPDGSQILKRIERKELGVTDAAQQLGVTAAAIYNALSKRRMRAKRPRYVPDPALDKIIAFAEQAFGEAVTGKIKALRAELDGERGRRESMEQELKEVKREVTELQRRSQES